MQTEWDSDRRSTAPPYRTKTTAVVPSRAGEWFVFTTVQELVVWASPGNPFGDADFCFPQTVVRPSMQREPSELFEDHYVMPSPCEESGTYPVSPIPRRNIVGPNGEMVDPPFDRHSRRPPAAIAEPS